MLASVTGLLGGDNSLVIDGRTSTSSCNEELGCELIELFNAASLFVEAATDSAVGAALFVEEVGEISLGTALHEIDGGLVVALGEELDGGEATDFVFGCKGTVGLGISVDISNNTLKKFKVFLIRMCLWGKWW